MLGLVDRFVLPAAYSLLPAKMASPEATALLLAIGLQESGFRHRVQVTDAPKLRQWWVGGPARGLWQFEAAGGCQGVLTHAASAPHLRAALRTLGYAPDISTADLHGVIAHNDVLAAVAARLLLWTVPAPLPKASAGAEAAWRYYIQTWRPGKPHRSTWDSHWADAWRQVVAAAR